MNEEQKEEGQARLANITFNDVMQVIASNNTPEDDKFVYIYLLNVIMDLHEKVDKLEAQSKKVKKKINNI